MPDRGASDVIVGAPDDDTAYFNFYSFTTPEIQFETSISQGTVREYSRGSSPFDSAAYVTDQVTYPSKDGTPVTMFIVHRKDVTPNGKNPTILYGYGGFNINMTPWFSFHLDPLAARLVGDVETEADDEAIAVTE